MCCLLFAEWTIRLSQNFCLKSKKKKTDSHSWQQICVFLFLMSCFVSKNTIHREAGTSFLDIWTSLWHYTVLICLSYSLSIFLMQLYQQVIYSDCQQKHHIILDVSELRLLFSPRGLLINQWPRYVCMCCSVVPARLLICIKSAKIIFLRSYFLCVWSTAGLERFTVSLCSCIMVTRFGFESVRALWSVAEKESLVVCLN